MHPIVTFEMEDGSVFRAELYPELAPNTVNNFLSLVQKGFYDGIIFHRVIEGFMIQGGDPKGVGTGGPGYHIKGEFKANGVENPVKHERGVLSMARAQHPRFRRLSVLRDARGGALSRRAVRRLRQSHRGDGGGGCDRNNAHRLPR